MNEQQRTSKNEVAASTTLVPLDLAIAFQNRAQHEPNCSWSREMCVCTCGLFELRLQLANAMEQPAPEPESMRCRAPGCSEPVTNGCFRDDCPATKELSTSQPPSATHIVKCPWCTRDFRTPPLPAPPPSDARVQELEAALRSYIAFSAEVFALIDADKEVKAMKLAHAMAGYQGYRHDVDAARNALTKGEGK